MSRMIVPFARARAAAMPIRLGGAVAMLALPAAAYAQPAPPAPDASPATEDIVVTAQRRSERLENVPMSVSVVNADAIERSGVSSLRDLGKLTAGVQVSLAGAFTQPAIRGVTSLTLGNGTENNVAVYVDGFYEPNSVTINSDLVNLSSIEVLKGPQGTLYGRNATGGAILINTLAPSATLTGRAEISYARFDDRKASAYISGPLSDRVRVSIAGSYHQRDGYQKLVDPNVIGNIIGHTNALKKSSVRTKLEADLTETLTATLAYNFSYQNDTAGHVYTPYEHVAAFLPAPPRRATKLGELSRDTAPILANTMHQATLKLVLETGFGNVSSYSGYTHYKDKSLFDFDGTYNQLVTLSSLFKQDSYQQTVDVNVTSIDRLNLIVGGNYFHDYTRVPDDEGIFNFGFNNSVTAISRPGTKTEAYSFYVDATYQLTDALSVNAGGRYSHDLKTIDFFSQSGAGVVLFPQTHKESTFSKFTPRASIRYEVAPRTNVYASVSRGYRSGAYNTAGAATPALLVATQPETITAYEIGLKSAPRGIRFDIAAFYYDYRNLQVSVNRPNANCPAGTTCVPVPLYANAKKAEVYGIDGHIDVTPLPRLNMGLSAAWLHARYKDFADASGLGLNPVTNLNVTQTQDWSGTQMARAPNFSGNANVDYTAPVAGGKLLLSSNVSYTDGFVISNPSLFGPLAGDRARRQRFRQGHYTLLAASATWTDASDRYSLGVFGTNLTNKLYRITYNGSALGDYSAIGMPRQIGVKAGYRF